MFDKKLIWVSLVLIISTSLFFVMNNTKKTIEDPNQLAKVVNSNDLQKDQLKNDEKLVGKIDSNKTLTSKPEPNLKPEPVAKPAPKATPTPTPTPKPAPAPAPNPVPSRSTKPQVSTILSAEKQKMLDSINSERAKVGIAPLKIDVKVLEVAQIKSSDMVKNNYFSHTSPTYGSPFDMLKKFGIAFSGAAENLALNSSVQAAHTALMASEGHRKNILNPSYKYIGIGISDGPKGKVFVQMFIKK